jgi:hypothetical protein
MDADLSHLKAVIMLAPGTLWGMRVTPNIWSCGTEPDV